MGLIPFLWEIMFLIGPKRKKEILNEQGLLRIVHPTDFYACTCIG